VWVLNCSGNWEKRQKTGFRRKLRENHLVTGKYKSQEAYTRVC